MSTHDRDFARNPDCKQFFWECCASCNTTRRQTRWGRPYMTFFKQFYTCHVLAHRMWTNFKEFERLTCKTTCVYANMATKMICKDVTVAPTGSFLYCGQPLRVSWKCHLTVWISHSCNLPRTSWLKVMYVPSMNDFVNIQVGLTSWKGCDHGLVPKVDRTSTSDLNVRLCGLGNLNSKN